MKPSIITPERGYQNNQMDKSIDRLMKGGTYKDQSTICVIPTRGMIHARVIQSWFGLILPMNQKYIRLFMTGMEVGDAYNQAVEYILADPNLSKWKYLMTMEDDNMPPQDGLLRLLESIEGGVDGVKYDCVGGLYWTKGYGGQPMIYGDPKVLPRNFTPQVPKPETMQPANGLGMGFNLYRLSMFKDERLQKPYFKTIQHFIPGQGAAMTTQDLYFYENAVKIGYKVASDNRVRVGHYDAEGDHVW